MAKNNEALLTKIASLAGMPYMRFKEHVGMLESKGLIKLTDLGDHVKIELTELGWRYLREYEQVKRFLATFGLD